MGCAQSATWRARSLEDGREWMRLPDLPGTVVRFALEELFRVVALRALEKRLPRPRETLALEWGGARVALVEVHREGEDLRTVRVTLLPAELRKGWTPKVPVGWQKSAEGEWNVFSAAV